MRTDTVRNCIAAHVVATIAAGVFLIASAAKAQDNRAANSDSASEEAEAATNKQAEAVRSLPEPKNAKRLSRDYPVWLDQKEKAILVDGQIALREGMLEMFACTRNTKEHESVVSAETKAYIVHAGLLTLGAEPGNPAQFQPQYKPASGTEIEVLVRWIDEKGKEQSARAQDWIKDIKTGKPMTYPFVFGGSRFWTDPDTGKQFYQAEGGDFVCVSNFGTAMLDIPVKSSQANEELAFAAFTEKIPPLGAPVRLVFKPKLTKQGAASREQGTERRQQPNDKRKSSAKAAREAK